MTQGETLLGSDSVLGQPTVIIRGRPLPGTVRTYWHAPALACEVVQYRVEAQQADGSLKLQTVGKPISLRIGEPDASLFDEGANYIELSPSEVVRKGLERLGIAWNKTMRAGEHEVSDQVYYSGR